MILYLTKHHLHLLYRLYHWETIGYVCGSFPSRRSRSAMASRCNRVKVVARVSLIGYSVDALSLHAISFI
jgi:hypothetical protein